MVHLNHQIEHMSYIIRNKIFQARFIVQKYKLTTIAFPEIEREAYAVKVLKY